MNEKLIESKLREQVKKLGGKALKFTSPSFSGVPDRIVLMPGGIMRFVELKSTGKGLRPTQKIVFPMLEKLGFPITIIDDQPKLDKFLKELADEVQAL